MDELQAIRERQNDRALTHTCDTEEESPCRRCVADDETWPVMSKRPVERLTPEHEDAIRNRVDKSGDRVALLREIDALRAERDKLRAAICEHRAQRADDRCWQDDQKLYAVLGDGDPGDNTTCDPAVMLENCKRFIERRCAGGEWKSYQQLEAESAELRQKANRWDVFIETIKGLGDAYDDDERPLVEHLLDRVKETLALRERASKAEADAAAKNYALGKLKHGIQKHQDWYPPDEVGKEHFVHALMQTYIDAIEAALSGQAGESILAVVRAAEALAASNDPDGEEAIALVSAVERLHKK